MDPKIKKAISKYFAPYSEVRYVTVYGSLVSGKLREDSDIDIAIYGSRSFTPEELVKWSTGLSEILRREVDLVDLGVSHGAILHEALMKGNRIFQRSPEDYAKILKKMWYDKEDDGRFRKVTQHLRLQAWKK